MGCASRRPQSKVLQHLQVKQAHHAPLHNQPTKPTSHLTLANTRWSCILRSKYASTFPLWPRDPIALVAVTVEFTYLILILPQVQRIVPLTLCISWFTAKKSTTLYKDILKANAHDLVSFATCSWQCLDGHKLEWSFDVWKVYRCVHCSSSYLVLDKAIYWYKSKTQRQHCRAAPCTNRESTTDKHHCTINKAHYISKIIRLTSIEL